MHQTKRKGELIMKEQNIKIVAKENNSAATGRKIAFGLTTFELALWICSAVVVAASYFLSKSEASSSLLSLAASLVGVTALIFVSAGNVIGQVLTIVFSVLYGIISFRTKYYGEMLTYLLMSAPAAGAAVIAWLKHPFSGDKTQVEINHLLCRECIFMTFLAAVTTVAFHFILKHFNTAQLFFGTLSVTTSFFAYYLAFRRSPFYAFAYAAKFTDAICVFSSIFSSISSSVISSHKKSKASACARPASPAQRCPLNFTKSAMWKFRMVFK